MTFNSFPGATRVQWAFNGYDAVSRIYQDGGALANVVAAQGG